MEILIIALAIFVAYYCAFISSSLNSLSNEKIDDLLSNAGNQNNKIQKKINTLHNLKIHYEDTQASFLLIEILFYLFAFSLLTVFLLNQALLWYFIVIIELITFIILSIFRSILWAVGARFADLLALKITFPANLLHFIISPFYKLHIKIIEAISGKEKEEASRDELNAMFETAREEGSIESDEYRILKNIMHFNEVLVTDVMTPRTMLFSCNADFTVGDVANMTELQMYSRFPLWEGNSIDDGIVGYVISKDIILAALKGKQAKKLRDFAREVYIIPENASLDKALEQFLQRRQHLSIVVDEYGGVEGIITMEDVLETILGVEIVDEADKIVDLREAAKNRRDKRIANFQLEKSN
jgi:CBS domain containing-hemolysin-like protein